VVAWKNALTGGHLKRVTRLVKYLRDIKGTFSIKSVLLTTLLGERISPIDELLPDKFADIPTALKTIIGRLDDWLQENEKMPEVENPALPGESFTRKWGQGQYDTLREKIQCYREWIDDAYDEEDRDESIRKWRRVFGDEFAKGETIDRATTAVARLAGSFQPGQDLVAVVLTYGRGVLTRMPRIFPHVEPPPRMSNNRIPVRVIAHEKRTEDGPVVRALGSGEPIDPQSGIRFQAVSNAGLPFPKDYQLRWQVVNTDRAAAEDGGLRGEFYRSDTHGRRYERTKYRGVHWVQAFLMNKRSGLCDGVSERFFVVIQ
jgi:hypothetical protein